MSNSSDHKSTYIILPKPPGSHCLLAFPRHWWLSHCLPKGLTCSYPYVLMCISILWLQMYNPAMQTSPAMTSVKVLCTSIKLYIVKAELSTISIFLDDKAILPSMSMWLWSIFAQGLTAGMTTRHHHQEACSMLSITMVRRQNFQYPD